MPEPAGGSVIQPLYNVCLAGKFGVGKTTIFQKVVNRDGSNGIAEFTYSVPMFSAKIKLFDTAGMERHSLSMGNYYRKCSCVVFVYDISDLESFHYLKKEYDFILEKGYCDTDSKFVILRNKIDVPSSSIMVTKEYETQYLQNNFGDSICCVVETSGDKNVGVEQFFRKDLVQILQMFPTVPIAHKKDIFKDYYGEHKIQTGTCCN